MSAASRIVTDANGRIVEAAPSAGELLGIADRWLVGKPLAAFVPEARRREFRALLLELARGGAPADELLRLRRRDGTELAVEVEAVAAGDGERLEWLLAVANGEDAAADASPKLLPEAAQLGRLLSRLPLGIVSVNRRLEIEYVNPAGGVYIRAVAGRELTDPWPEFSLREFARRLFSSMPPARKVVEIDRGRLLELDGIVEAGSGSAILMLQDVTGRERRRRAEAEFVANAAHELRTPIAAIRSAVELLRAGAMEPSDRDLFLGHIDRESDRLGRLAGALLLLARIQIGQAQPSLELVELRPVLEEVASQLALKPGVDVHVFCSEKLAALADRDLLQQAVWNVATNAAKHTSTGRITLSGRDAGSISEIEVEDTGAGISDEQQARVFERFFRGERRGGDGFGLGLPIAREILAALGGSLSLHSQPGSGTRVRLKLPSARVIRA